MPLKIDESVQRRVRQDGRVEVAMAHYAPITISTVVDDRKYEFIYQHNVALAWVLESDVQRVSAVYKICCGGNKKYIFRLANKQQVNIHMTGDPRKDWNA